MTKREETKVPSAPGVGEESETAQGPAIVEQPKARAMGGLNVNERNTRSMPAGQRPFDVSGNRFEGFTPQPTVTGFPEGVFNDPSAGCLQFLCIKDAGEVAPDDHRPLSIGALFVVGTGEIIVEHDDETPQGARITVVRRHWVRMGHIFRVTTKTGPKPIKRLLTTAPESEGPRLGDFANVWALPCGVVCAVSKGKGDKSVHHALRRHRAAGALVCPRCQSDQLTAWSQPDDEPVEPNMLFIHPGEKTDFSPGFVKEIKERLGMPAGT